MNTKTVIISGTRTINDYDALDQAIKSSPWYGHIDTVFVGDAKGVDSLAVRWCKNNGITYRVFRADWSTWGKAAGPERNATMCLEGGEALILLWDGESKGSKNMKRMAKHYQIPIHEVVLHHEHVS